MILGTLFQVKSNRMMMAKSKKSHSWWWDSHISPKNSKWLQDNLLEMDHLIKRILKLIEEDADTFAKKAEMYYQKRPELVNLIEEFYRMYRSLAERYDHVTGELRRNMPADLQSPSSCLSEVGSEPPSSLPSPGRPANCRKSSGLNRAPGFDYFLGSLGGEESSTLDSESESDDSSVNNYPVGPTQGNDDEEQQGLRRRIFELEVELRDAKEKNYESYNGNYGKIIAGYEEELRVARDKIQASEEEINRLMIELQKYKSIDVSEEAIVMVDRVETLEEELRVIQEKLCESEKEVASLRDEITIKGSLIRNLQDQLKSSQNKLEIEKSEVLKLQDRVTRYKMNLSDRDQEIRGLSEENEQLLEKLARISKEKTYLENNLKEVDLRCLSLEEDMRQAKGGKTAADAVFTSQIEQLKAERDEINTSMASKDDQIDQMSKHLHQLHIEHVNLISGAEAARKSAEELRGRIKELEREVKRKEAIIKEGAEEKREAIRQLCFSLEHYRNGYYRLREVVMGHKRSTSPVKAS